MHVNGQNQYAWLQVLWLYASNGSTWNHKISSNYWLADFHLLRIVKFFFQKSKKASILTLIYSIEYFQKWFHVLNCDMLIYVNIHLSQKVPELFHWFLHHQITFHKDMWLKLFFCFFGSIIKPLYGLLLSTVGSWTVFDQNYKNKGISMRPHEIFTKKT